MSTNNYYNFGTINNDHSKHVTINAPGADVSSLVRSIFAEDITPEPEEKPESKSEHFPFLTRRCFEEKREETVDAEFRAACKGTAEALWRTLWNNENLGYVEVEHKDATTIFRGIEKWYGELPYNERNFRKARNKRGVPRSSA